MTKTLAPPKIITLNHQKNRLKHLKSMVNVCLKSLDEFHLQVLLDSCTSSTNNGHSYMKYTSHILHLTNILITVEIVRVPNIFNNQTDRKTDQPGDYCCLTTSNFVHGGRLRVFHINALIYTYTHGFCLQDILGAL